MERWQEETGIIPTETITEEGHPGIPREDSTRREDTLRTDRIRREAIPRTEHIRRGDTRGADKDIRSTDRAGDIRLTDSIRRREMIRAETAAGRKRKKGVSCCLLSNWYWF